MQVDIGDVMPRVISVANRSFSRIWHLMIHSLTLTTSWYWVSCGAISQLLALTSTENICRALPTPTETNFPQSHQRSQYSNRTALGLLSPAWSHMSFSRTQTALWWFKLSVGTMQHLPFRKRCWLKYCKVAFTGGGHSPPWRTAKPMEI